MSELNDEIKAAIDKELPNLIGQQLKKALDEFDELKSEYSRLEIVLDNQKLIIQNLRDEKESLQKLNNDEQSVRSREKAVLVQENKNSVDKAILDIKETMMNDRLNDIKELTKNVFGSNRMNYNVDLNKTVYPSLEMPHQSNNFQPLQKTSSSEKTVGVISEQL